MDRAIAHEALRKLNAGKVKGKSVKVRVLDGEGVSADRQP